MDRQAWSAGIITALVGFTGSFTVVLAGLRAVGASDSQASSGLLALSIGMGLLAALTSIRTRMPISIAWSTPGAALMSSTHHLGGGFRCAVGAFLVCAALTVTAGVVPALRRLASSIPAPVASALLAGILLELCLAPVRLVVHSPAYGLPVVAGWLLVSRVARRYAVPVAMVVAVIEIVIASAGRKHIAASAPHLSFITPTLTVGAVTLGITLFLVTTAAQNVPGMAVLAQFGYHPAFGPLLRDTGIVSALTAPFGGHVVNLAAISAALAAGPDAGPDPDKRWPAAVVAGFSYIGLGLLAGLLVGVLAAAPADLIQAVAGLALLVPFAHALVAAVHDEALREAAVVTFLVTASGVVILGIGAALWALVAGLVLATLPGRHRTPG